MKDIDTLVHDKVLALVKLRNPTAKGVSTDQELRADLGLDSLDLAELGAELEGALATTIFEDVAIGAILTVGDLAQVCRKSAPSAKAES